MLVLSQRPEQLSILSLVSDGDSQTVAAKLNLIAVSYDDALCHQIIVDGLRIRNLYQEEVGIRRINLHGDRQIQKGSHHLRTLLKDVLHPLIHLQWILQNLKCLLLGKQIHIIRILHLIEYINNLLAGKRHTQTKRCTTPCLTHRIEHDEIREMLQHTTEGALGREIAISLIHNDYTIKEAKHLYDSLAIDVIARRVARSLETAGFSVLLPALNVPSAVFSSTLMFL